MTAWELIGLGTDPWAADTGPATSATTPGTPRCSVVITTKNRKEELEAAIASVLAQDVPLELIVIDDGSTDGTAELVPTKFPGARYYREASSRGYMIQRNRGAALARTGMIASIDDDAAFVAPDTLRRALDELDHPRAAVVGMPYLDIYKHEGVRQRAADANGIHVLPQYVGTAHVIRRDLFVGLGGYRGELIRQGEENDLSIRLLAIGYVVRAGATEPIRHLESPKRNFDQLFEYNARNHIAYAWNNIPMPFMPVRIAGMTFNLLRWGVKKGRTRATVRGLMRGYWALARGGLGVRRPVSRKIYALSRRIQRAGMVRLADIEAELPSVVPVEAGRPLPGSILRSISGGLGAG